MKTHKDIFYFSTYQAAREYAETNNFPHDRIISYDLGWAIQWRVSGPYVGPSSPYEIFEWQHGDCLPRFIIANQRFTVRNGDLLRLAIYNTRNEAQQIVDFWLKRLAA